MFDSRQSIFGIPAEVIVLAVAVGAAVVGLLWLRSIVTIESEVHSFRATDPRGRPWIAIVAIVAVVTVLALLIAPAVLR
jgi:hypothetical protein